MAAEARFYTGNKHDFKGFYFAPYLKYESYNVKTAITYDSDNNRPESMKIDGSLNGFTAGLSIGLQWKIANSFYLDWRIIGVGYGFSNGKLSGKMTLSQSEQNEIRKILEDVDLPLTNKNVEVNGQGATVKLDGPWAGLRTGLSVGYRF